MASSAPLDGAEHKLNSWWQPFCFSYEASKTCVFPPDSFDTKKCFPIEIPKNDPFWKGRKTCMAFTRSLAAPTLKCSLEFQQQVPPTTLLQVQQGFPQGVILKKMKQMAWLEGESFNITWTKIISGWVKLCQKGPPVKNAAIPGFVYCKNAERSLQPLLF